MSQPTRTTKTASRPLPPLTLLAEMFSIVDGVLIRKTNVGPMKVGSAAGSLTKKGFRKVKVQGVYYYAHRLIYFMQTGEQPTAIRHIDGDRANDLIENLSPRAKCQEPRP